MKSLLSLFLLLVTAPLLAQTTITGKGTDGGYQWQLLSSGASSSIYTVNQAGAPVSFTIDEVTSGTAPTTCTYEVESSPDGTNWNAGSGSLSGPLSCTSLGVATTSFLSKPVRYLRINVTAYSGGDGTTRLTFYYTRGVSQ